MHLQDTNLKGKAVKNHILRWRLLYSLSLALADTTLGILFMLGNVMSVVGTYVQSAYNQGSTYCDLDIGFA
jgi:hypothetical protein